MGRSSLLPVLEKTHSMGAWNWCHTKSASQLHEMRLSSAFSYFYGFIQCKWSDKYSQCIPMWQLQLIHTRRVARRKKQHTKQIMAGREDVTTGPMCNYLNEIDLIEYINEPFLRGATRDILAASQHLNCKCECKWETPLDTSKGNEALKTKWLVQLWRCARAVYKMKWHRHRHWERTCKKVVRALASPADDLTLGDFNLLMAQVVRRPELIVSTHLWWNFFFLFVVVVVVVWLILLSTRTQFFAHHGQFSLYTSVALFFAVKMEFRMVRKVAEKLLLFLLLLK